MKPPFAAYRGDEPYVFVCYSHQDAAEVYRDIALLRSRGINLWYDEGISPGTEWSEDLARALEGASHVVFYVSDHSANSRHCRDEIHFGLNHSKPIVTVYLAQASLPVGLELSIGSTQAIHKFNLSDEQYLDKLSAALAGVVAAQGSPAPGPAPGPVPASAEARPVATPARARRRSRWTYALIGVPVLLVALAAFNRDTLIASTIIYLPWLYSDSIEQDIGFAQAVDGNRIAYATTGQGPPLVIVLGWATHLQKGVQSPAYDNLGTLAMSSEHHRVVRYDGRGFGLSDRGVTDFSLEARVSDLEAVVDALGLQRFALYAMSAGGPTGIAYAQKHPDRVVSLVLASTQASPKYMSEADRERFELMLALFDSSWSSGPVTNLMVELLNPKVDEVGRKVVGEFLRRAGDGPDVAGFFRQYLQINVEEQAQQLRVPTLVIHARDDSAIPLEAGRTLASLIPGAKFEIVEGDHSAGTGNTPAVRRMILDFVESVPDPQAL